MPQKPNLATLAPLVVLLTLRLVLSLGLVPSIPILAPAKATAATYVYEKNDTAPPAQVMAALDRLNREKKIFATLFEQDTKDGDGEVPAQYRVPLDEAKKAGLPALVVTNGETVLAVVKAPTTEQQVLEAVP